MPLDPAIQQLITARDNAVKAIAVQEDAFKRDGFDRSVSIASLTRDIANYEFQIERLSPKTEQEAPVEQVVEQTVAEDHESTETHTPE